MSIVLEVVKVTGILNAFQELSSVLYMGAEVVNLRVARYLFRYSGHIFVSFFLLFDNASVIMMMVGNPFYRIIRRISYSAFLIGIIWKIMAFTIRLRESFRLESDLKKVLEEMTPVQFL